MITIFWFSIGGYQDLKNMMNALRSNERDHEDAGWVRKIKIKIQRRGK